MGTNIAVLSTFLFFFSTPLPSPPPSGFWSLATVSLTFLVDTDKLDSGRNCLFLPLPPPPFPRSVDLEQGCCSMQTKTKQANLLSFLFFLSFSLPVSSVRGVICPRSMDQILKQASIYRAPSFLFFPFSLPFYPSFTKLSVVDEVRVIWSDIGAPKE